MTLERTLCLVGVRRHARMLVGTCSDYQIMYCAMKAKVIGVALVNLDDLDDINLRRLADWMMEQELYG